MNLHDIAREAGVSTATVSRVINGSTLVVEETRKKVQAVIDKHRYTPNALARGLIQKSTKTIGVLTVDIRSPYFSSVVHSVERELKQLGYNIFLCNTGGNLEEKIQYITALMERKADGLVFVGSIYKEKEHNRHIIEAAAKVPVILLNNHIRGFNIYSLLCDDARGIYDATRFMLDQGKKNLIYIHSSSTFSGRSKRKGFRQALKDSGTNTVNGRILTAVPDKDSMIEKIKLEYKKDPFDGVLTSDDIYANQTVFALSSIKVDIPGTVAVMGYNNSSICDYTYPALSSVDSCMNELGIQGGRLLDGILSGRIPEKQILFLPPKLVIRETT